MSNIFISHSSVDKPFIKKLAFVLLTNGSVLKLVEK